MELEPSPMLPVTHSSSGTEIATAGSYGCQEIFAPLPWVTLLQLLGFSPAIE